MTAIRARNVRVKSFREYLLDLKKPENERSDFVYAKTGKSVSPDALVVPEFGPYDPIEKLHRIEAILRKAADERGWNHIELVEEE